MAPKTTTATTKAPATDRPPVRLATRLLLLSMLPLLVALCIDIYLIARIIAGSPLASVLAVTVGGFFIALWFVLPRISDKQPTKAQ